MNHSLPLILLAASAASASAQTMPADEVHSVTLEPGDLSVLFRDNSNSPKVLSGIGSLINRRQADGFNAFDTAGRGSSAGLNFEHIISGHNDPENMAAPRKGRYTLHRMPDGRSVTLVREAKDCPWGISSVMKYTLTEPNIIDLDFECVPHD